MKIGFQSLRDLIPAVCCTVPSTTTVYFPVLHSLANIISLSCNEVSVQDTYILNDPESLLNNMTRVT